MKLTVVLEIDNQRMCVELATEEDFRGDFRRAITECASRMELATYGPQLTQDGMNFDEKLRMRGGDG